MFSGKKFKLISYLPLEDGGYYAEIRLPFKSKEELDVWKNDYQRDTKTTFSCFRDQKIKNTHYVCSPLYLFNPNKMCLVN